MKIKSKILLFLTFFFSIGILEAQYTYWGSGSRDLYPEGAYGGRSTLRASLAEQNFFPFPTMGTHYVYAREGETIAIASSTQAYGSNNSTRNSNRGNITLYGLDGNPINLATGNNADTFGRIDSRSNELAGPRFRPGTASDGNKYRALYYEVPTGGTGIYRVEFRGTGTQGDADNTPNDLRATDNWSQSNNTRFIYAWDISVANTQNNAWIPGRVYMNIFNSMNSNVNGSNWRGDAYNNYAKFIVHTRDGFMYEVDNNGNAGYRSSFYVNNKGFHAVGDPSTPSYQSIPASTAAAVKNRSQDPRAADGSGIFTHKIFYSLPDPSMPTSASGAVPGGSTWLHIPQANLDVAYASFEGVDGGTIETAGRKGGHFVFDSGEGVQYIIEISSPGLLTRRITGFTENNGENRVYWDGKDGSGNEYPVGITPTNVSLQLRGAEVHFPFIDMEINPNGLKLRQFNSSRTDFVSDKVYWNDEPLGNGGGTTGGVPTPKNASHTVIPGGTSSAGMGGATPNGHRWGSSTGPSNGSTFGNNQGMDTWTFAQGNNYSKDFTVEIKEADLQISHFNISKTGDLYIGDELTYSIGIKNNGGPSDVEGAMFQFKLPEGFVSTGDMTFNGNACGTEEVGNQLTFDATTNTFTSLVNLPVGCEITYTIKVEITDSAGPGNQEFAVGIMRPNDLYDPDGTNVSDPENPVGDPNHTIDINNYFYPPFSPFFEAEHNGQANSNNVDYITSKVVIVDSKDDINQVASADTVNGNLLTNDERVDEIVEVKFNGITIPFNTETTLTIGGVTYGKITIQTNGTYVFEAAPTFEGSVPPITYLGENSESGNQSEAKLYIEVIGSYVDDGSNNAPVAHHDRATVKQGETVTVHQTSNDIDIDNHPLTVTSIHYNGSSISSNSSSPTSIVVEGITAGFAYKDANGKLVFEADENFKGEVPFTYTVSDGEGGTDSGTIVIDVVGTSFPVDANDDAKIALKGETIEGNIIENDKIQGNLTTITLTLEDSNGNQVSVTTASPTDVYQNGVKIGNITMDASGEISFIPEADFVGSTNIPYTICDEFGNCSSATLYLTLLDGIRAKEVLCVTGCNDNSYMKALNPNTIEYDNMVALFHSTIVKEVGGVFKVWGQGIGNTSGGGMQNVLTPQDLNATNYPNLTGEVLKVTGGSTGATSNGAQFAALTTDGLFVWGHTDHLVSTTIKNNSVLDRVSIGTVDVNNGSNPSYSKGLPYGVEPEDVKMLFGSYRTLVITTCEGKVWVLSYNGNKNGDGTSQGGTNNNLWHPVYKSTTTNGSTKGDLLENVVATRGTSSALFALTSDGELYTWGTNTYINSGSASNRTYATQVSKPAGVTPKMIGMTKRGTNNQTYYLLATDGRLFAMGDNNQRQLGNLSTTNSTTWVQPQKPATEGQGTGNLEDIVWISPNEHDNYGQASINVLTNDGKLWAWGSNSGLMIGGATNDTNYDPIYMPGKTTGAYDQGKLNTSDVLMAVETGGHISISIKQCSKKYGYVGHKTNGSMGDGTSTGDNISEYNFVDTVELVVCGAVTSPLTEENVYICPSTTIDLNDAIISNTPDGYTLEWWSTIDRQPGTEVSNPESVGVGVYYSFYIPGAGACDNPDGSIVNVIELQNGDPGFELCQGCYKDGNFQAGLGLPTQVGISSLRIDNSEGWPQVREGAWIALEAKTKGFVLNRLSTTQIENIPSENLVEGMMLYNTTEDCIQINIDGTESGWKCFTKQGCL